jgi:hypothetical protein
MRDRYAIELELSRLTGTWGLDGFRL